MSIKSRARQKSRVGQTRGSITITDGAATSGSAELLEESFTMSMAEPSVILPQSSDPPFITTKNDGATMVESNYWDIRAAQQGLFYLSINAGAFRLLAPDNQISFIQEILTGQYAVISHGFHRMQNKTMHEIMFEDNSETPFALWLSENQVERCFSIDDAASRERELIIYRRGCVEVVRMPVYFRTADVLPCLKRWPNSVEKKSTPTEPHVGTIPSITAILHSKPRLQGNFPIDPKINPYVLRFECPDSGPNCDRHVPVVLSIFAKEKDLRQHAILVEEYIAEELDYRVEDDLLVLNSDGDLRYDKVIGLIIPDHYNRPYSRQPDGIPVHTYQDYLAWTKEPSLGAA